MAYYTYGKWYIPDYMKDGIENYLERRIKPGSFLLSILSNNFAEAVVNADRDNLDNLPAYGYWLWNEVPSQAWGSPEKVEKWLKHQ